MNLVKGLRLLALSLLFPIGSAGLAHGQGEAPNGIVISLNYQSGAFSPEFVDFIAQYGARSHLDVVPGQRLADYVIEACGQASPSNLDLFGRALEADGMAVAEDGSIEGLSGSTLAVPPCLPEPKSALVPKLALPETTFFDYFTADSAGSVAFGNDRLVQRSPEDVIAATGNVAPPDSLGEFDVGDRTQIHDYLNQRSQRWLSNDKPEDEAAFDAFLAANELVQAGSDPAMVTSVIAETYAEAGRPRFARDVEAALSGALDKYSNQPDLTSERWANIPAKSPSSAEGKMFTDEIQWLDPNPRVLPGAALAPGDIALVPQFRSQPVQIVIDPGRLPEGADDPVALVSGRLDEIESDVPVEITLLETQGISAVANSRCDNATYKNWGTDAFEDAFAAAIARSRLLGFRSGQNSNDVQIAVIDSGFVPVSKMGAFERGALNLSGQSLEVEEASASLGERRAHGTAVAGVAIGGPDLWGLTNALGLDISITPRRIYRELTIEGVVVPQVDLIKLYDAIDSEAQIFNLSFATTDKRSMDEFARFLGPYAQKLFVVAAGNNNLNYDSGGVDLVVTNLYPQLFSDESSAPNLITVASYDGVGRAWFSNFSDDYVAIAAPGCAIASWMPDVAGQEYVAARFAGTSFSAPIVSYVAAIVASLMPSDRQSPIWVRTRLLASADLVAGLSGVTDGRLLNPIKAVSVYEDLVELSDGTLVRGNLGQVNPRTLCTVPGLAPDAVLLKFARLPEPRNGKDSVIYYLRHRTLQSMDCNQIPNNNLGMSTSSGNVVIAVKDARDIIMRTPGNGTD